MKITEKYTYTSRECPNGHKDGLFVHSFCIPSMSDILKQENCTVCGAKLIEVKKSGESKSFICDNCKSVVTNIWKYCPYCGTRLTTEVKK